MKKLRVLMVTPYYPPNFTAGSTRVSEMVERISSHPSVEAVEVAVWNPFFEYAREMRSHSRKVTITASSFGVSLFKRAMTHHDPNPFYTICWFFLTGARVRRHHPDVVIFTAPPGVVLGGAAWCKMFGTRYCIDYRDFWQERNELAISRLSGPVRSVASALQSLLKFIARECGRSAFFVVTVHDDIKRKLEADGVTKVVIVPNGINQAEAERIDAISRSSRITEKTHGRRIVAYVGQLGLQYYTPEAILEPIANLVGKFPSIELWVFTSSSDGGFEDSVRRSGLEKRVRTLSEPHDQMLGMLRNAAFGIIPLKTDDPQAEFVIPAKFYDYVVAGIPILVIASRTSAIYRFVAENGNGICLTWEEAEKIEASVRNLLESPGYAAAAKALVGELARKFDRSEAYSEMLSRLVN